MNAAGTQVAHLRLQQRHASAQNLFNQTDLVFKPRDRPRSATRCWPASSSAGRRPTTSATPATSPRSARPSRRSSSPSRAPRPTRRSTFRPERHRRRQPRRRHGRRRSTSQDQVALSRQRAGGRRPPLRPLRRRLPQQPHRRRRSRARDDAALAAAGAHRKPAEPVSLYASYSVSYLPSAGDQFSLAHADQPARSSRRSSATTRSARSGTAAPASPSPRPLYRPRPQQRGRAPTRRPARHRSWSTPSAPAASSSGVTGNVTGRWRVMGGYAYQDGEITQSISATAPAGARARAAAASTRSRCGTATTCSPRAGASAWA